MEQNEGASSTQIERPEAALASIFSVQLLLSFGLPLLSVIGIKLAQSHV